MTEKQFETANENRRKVKALANLAAQLENGNQRPWCLQPSSEDSEYLSGFVRDTIDAEKAKLDKEFEKI